jgi:hypothetical protein
MSTPGAHAYGAYVTAIERREVSDAILLSMWLRLMPTEQRVWEAVAEATRAYATEPRQRGAAVCAVCSALLDAGRLYCPVHPQAEVYVELTEESDHADDAS